MERGRGDMTNKADKRRMRQRWVKRIEGRAGQEGEWWKEHGERRKMATKSRGNATRKNTNDTTVSTEQGRDDIEQDRTHQELTTDKQAGLD